MDNDLKRFCSEYKVKSYIYKITMVIFMVQIIFCLINKSIINYVLFIDVYLGILSIIVILIVEIFSMGDEIRWIKYLLWGYLFASVFTWKSVSEIKIISEGAIVLTSELFKSIYIHNFYTINIYQIFIMIISIISMKLKKSLFITNIVLLTMAVITYSSVGNMIKGYIRTENTLVISCYIIIYVAISCCCAVYVYFNRSSIPNGHFNKVAIYLILLVLLVLLVLLNCWSALNLYNISMNFIFIQSTLKLYIYISIFAHAEKEIVKISLEKDLSKIEKAIKLNKKYNVELKDKEKNLIEIENKSKRSIKKTLGILDSLTDGMMIFENGILIYKNISSIMYIERVLENEKKYIYLIDCLEELIGEEISKEEIDEGFKRELEILNSENNRENIEIILMPVKVNIKVLLIKNRSFIMENLRLEKEYNLYVEKKKMEDGFYSNVSHELRTPINVISAALQLNSKLITECNLKTIERNNNIIKQNCNRLIRTVSNFIDTNKLRYGYLDKVKNKINLVYLIDDIVGAASKYAEMKGCKVIFDPLQEEIYIYANLDHLCRVFFNIISNALKYGKENERIYITTYTINKHVEVSVIYKSLEMPKEVIKNMFKKFSKGENYLTRNAEGSGLGLYITKKFVEHNGGKINFESLNGQNIFTILMPLTKITNEDTEFCNLNMNDIERQADIEFSDIYF